MAPRVVGALLLGLLSASAHAENAVSMKGWELRSWHDPSGACIAQVHSAIDPAWCFSLVAGTNREKTRDEVVKNPLSEKALFTRLQQLKSGEEIFWVTDGRDFKLPADAVRTRVESEAKRLGLKLSKP
jgi:hypothetical protein